MAISRHLGFSEIESFTVKSAIPENPTLEPEIALISQPDAKYWPLQHI